MMKRALVFLAPGFEELESIAPIDLLRRADVQVVTASVGAPNPIVGRNRIRVMADVDLGEALVEWGDDWDLVLVPGGAKGVEGLLADERVLGLLRGRLTGGKLTGAICAGPRVLARAGLAAGTPITSHPGVQAELEGSYDYRTEAVVVSGPVITSRGPGTAVAFGLACVEALCGAAVAGRIRESIVDRY